MKNIFPPPEETNFYFQANEERLCATIAYNAIQDAPQVLFLHGAGSSNRNRTAYLADALAWRGMSSLRFDFSGHGESSGELGESTLQKRINEALAATQYLDLKTPIKIIASSMGGHIAVEITKRLSVESLILFCPAAYGASTVSIPFGSGFTEMIREAESWRNSPAFDALDAFSGRLLHIIGARDEIIPKQVTALYAHSATHTAQCNFLTVQDAPHGIHTWLEEHSAEQTKIVELVGNFLTSNGQ